jgi:hypothetical protein
VVDVRGDSFEAACGPLDLPATLQIFRDWVSSNASLMSAFDYSGEKLPLASGMRL